MEILNRKLSLLKGKVENSQPITIMIIGLGSVGCYLLDYLVSLGDSQLRLVVVGRNAEKMQMDINIIRTASTIRHQCRSEIKVVDNCDLNDVNSIAAVLEAEKPDFIVNSSRVYSGLKYGSISWSNLRAYGIWTPLSIRYAKNIMEAYDKANCEAISINTSYSDAVIPWLKSAGKAYFDFGSGNLNHLVPRIKFYIAEKYGIKNFNDIDVTIAVSHFHDVVISKEGHAEGKAQGILTSRPLTTGLLCQQAFSDTTITVEEELLKSCSIAMPVDQKRNMMNASSNFDIIFSVLTALREEKQVKIHTPGVNGEIGGYPIIIDGVTATAKFDESVWTIDQMRKANRESIYCDGVENITDATLVYTDELVAKVKKSFNVDLPKSVKFVDIENVADLIINQIIKPQVLIFVQ